MAIFKKRTLWVEKLERRNQEYNCLKFKFLTKKRQLKFIYVLDVFVFLFLLIS